MLWPPPTRGPRGFKELAGVSHLGPALATLVQLRTRYQDNSWHAEAERLLEDPRQLLPGCVTDYAVSELVAADNDPTKVVVPGLSGTTYPTHL
jgi:hypothetical protein